MKRIVSLLLACLMLAGCVFALASCGSSYGTLKKAFADKGYTESEDVETTAEAIKKELEGDELALNVHLLINNDALLKPKALVIEFKTTEELVNFYKDSNTAQGLVKDVAENEDVQAVYDALAAAGHVKDNCFVLPLSLVYYKEITDIVKGA